MPAPKKLTIGVSVNLQRYENLRLTVEGEVETEEDAEDLARYLDHVLARFGRNDPETASQIDRYRERVMPVEGTCGEEREAASPLTAPPCGETVEATPPPAKGSPVSPGPAAAPGYLSRRADVGEGGAASAPAPAPVPPAPSSPPAPAVSAGSGPAVPGSSPASSAGAGDHGRCEECGAPLSRQEAKLSHLFVDRLLCKKCLDALQD